MCPNDYKTWSESFVPWLDTRCPHHCPRSTTGPIPLWNRPTCGPLADLTIMQKVAKWLQNMIWDIGSMAWHNVSAPLSRFHNRTHPVVAPAHLWTLGWLVNGAKSCQMITEQFGHWFAWHNGQHHCLGSTRNLTGPWTYGWLDNGVCQMIIKHDLRHWFHGRTPCVRTTVPVPQQDPSRCGTGPLVDPWLTWQWRHKLPNDYKHDLSHWFYARTPGDHTTVSVPQQDPSRCGTGPFVDQWLTWKWCQKLPNDYKTWFATLVPWLDTRCPHHVPVPQQDPSRCGTSPLVDPWLTCKWCQKLPNDYRTWSHWLYGRTPCVRTMIPVVEPAHWWMTCEWCLGWHWFHGWTPGVRTTVPVPQQDPSRCGTSPLVDPWLTCKWCQKLPNDYRTWFEPLVPWPDTMCPHHCPGSTTGPIPLLAHLWTLGWLVNGAKSCQMIKNHDLRPMAGHHVSAPLWFHNRTHPLWTLVTCKWCQKLPND